MTDCALPKLSLSSVSWTSFCSRDTAMSTRGMGNLCLKKSLPGTFCPGDQRGTRHESPSRSRVGDAVFLGGAYFGLRPCALGLRTCRHCRGSGVIVKRKRAILLHFPL